MKEDTFLTQPNCDRCSKEIAEVSKKLGHLPTRQMSWFTEDCLCEDCSSKEKILRRALEKDGVDVSDLEGCGYMPQLNGE